MKRSTLLDGLTVYWPLHDAANPAVPIVGSSQPAGATSGVTQGKVITSTRYVSQGQTIADNAEMSTGDIDFTWACWGYLDSYAAATSYTALSKRVNPNPIEYMLQKPAADSTRFYAGGNNYAEIGGALATVTWYFLMGWHDAGANIIGHRRNTTEATQAFAGPAIDDAGAFAIARDPGGNYWQGRLCEMGFWKRMLCLPEREWLYNNGLGRTYPFDGRPSPMLRHRPLHGGGRRVFRVPGPVGAWR